MFTIEFTGEFVAFFILSAMMICGAVFMISLQKVVHMVISMAAVFLGLAGMYVLLEAEFIAFVQVLIYAGAVSILMIFGIMMTKHHEEQSEPAKPLHETLAAIGALCLFGILFYAIRVTTFPDPKPFQGGENNTLNIGQLLYTGYVVPFELLSVLLTVAFIGAIAIAKQTKAGSDDGMQGEAAGAQAQAEGVESLHPQQPSESLRSEFLHSQKPGESLRSEFLHSQKPGEGLRSEFLHSQKLQKEES